MDAVDAGRRLAERHSGQDEVDPVRSLLNYAEEPHDGDWTLRSALVRLAQPDPARVGSLLELMRRLDAPLHHVARHLQRHAVTCDGALAADRLDRPPGDPHPDARTADLARLVAAGLPVDDVVRGYDSVAPLDREERLAVPLLAVAVRFGQLARRLAAWASAGPADPPVSEVDAVIAEVSARLDELGVPVETGPPPGAARQRRP